MKTSQPALFRTPEAEPQPSCQPLPSTATLYHGDCLEVMPTLEAGSVAMMIADLPYGTTGCAWDKTIDLPRLWAAVKTCVTPRTVFLFTATQPFASDIIASSRKTFRYDLIWQKGRAVGFLNANRMPLRAHEVILVFYSKTPSYTPQKTKGERIVPPFTRKGSGSAIYNGPKNFGGYVDDGTRHPISVLKFSSGQNKSKALHPTQKPVALLEWLIATYTNPGDTVLDPCFGSNATGVACARLGRNYIGIEKDPEYFRIGSERLEAERERLGLSNKRQSMIEA